MFRKKPRNDQERRDDMVERQIERRGVKDEAVFSAMRRVPRRLFMPEDLLESAYNDGPQPIGERQTISQPYIVAYMTEQLQLKKTDRVLEIGTGSGYQAAILAEIAAEVFTVEIIPELHERSKKLLTRELGYTNIHFRLGNGRDGWPEEAPFDKIIATAAPVQVPPALIEQLAVRGRIVIPVGSYYQYLKVIRKTEDGVHYENLTGVRFVPMTGE